MKQMKKVCIIGMGYVGLTLAVVLAERGFSVTGVEVNAVVADQLKRCQPHFHEQGLQRMMKTQLGKTLFVRTDVPSERQDIFIIAVGTPIDPLSKQPLMHYIVQSSESISKNLEAASSSSDSLSCPCEPTLIILRSTVPVGVTRGIVKPILDRTGASYALAFCPERTIEGRAIQELKELPQIVGGFDEESVSRASSFFRKIVPTIIEVSSLEAAEMIKIVNNTYRDVLFAYGNEIGMVCETLSLDAVEIAKAANLGYKRSNVPLPGFVGGACLSKDPHILVSFCRERGYEPQLVLGGRRLNESLPAYIAGKAEKKLASFGCSLGTAKLFVSGFAFKGVPPTDDTRDSSSLQLVAALREKGAQAVYGHDFVVPSEKLTGLGVIPLTLEEGFHDADCVIIANNHPDYEHLDIEHLLSLAKKPVVFLDCWHLFDKHHFASVSGVLHGGIGFD